MRPEILAGSLAQLAAFMAVGWVVGDALLRRAFGIEHGSPRTVGRPERALAAVFGGVAFSVAMMLFHLLTGGAVFGIPGVVPIFGLGLIVYGWDREVLPRGLPWRGLLLIAALGIALYALPVWVGGGGIRTGDSPWHLGWTEQLLAGEPVPTGPAPEFARNAYPWGFHSVLATMTRLVPGTNPQTALESLHLLIALSLPLAAACLARRVRRDAGWTAAFAMALIGGFGWVLARGPGFAVSPREPRFGADMVVASPNAAYELFAPALPRELGLVLLGTCGVLLALAVARTERRIGFLAGVAAGLAGLVSVPIMVAGIVWILFLGLVVGRMRRAPVLFALPPALLIFAAWAGPVIANYTRYGGFVNVTPRLGVEWPILSSLGSWGLLLPAALAGLLIARSLRIPGSRTLIALTLATILLLVVSFARSYFQWDLKGNETLFHQGRVWPVLHLVAAALAGVALRHGYELIARRTRVLGALAAVLVGVVGAASPVLAAGGFAEVVRERDGGFIYSSPDLEPGSFVREAALELDPDDVVSVGGSDETLEDGAVRDSRLAFFLWQFSGAGLADYDDSRLEDNDLRIRYADLAEAWEEKRATGGFEPDYLIVPESSAPSFADPLLRGTFQGEVYLLLRAD